MDRGPDAERQKGKMKKKKKKKKKKTFINFASENKASVFATFNKAKFYTYTSTNHLS
jgi:hypothetical protein